MAVKSCKKLSSQCHEGKKLDGHKDIDIPANVQFKGSDVVFVCKNIKKNPARSVRFI